MDWDQMKDEDKEIKMGWLHALYKQLHKLKEKDTDHRETIDDKKEKHAKMIKNKIAMTKALELWSGTFMHIKSEY